MSKKFNDIKLKDHEIKKIGNYSNYKNLSNKEAEWVEEEPIIKNQGLTFRAKREENGRIIYYFCPKADCYDCRKCFDNECGDGICCDAWVKMVFEKKK